ncbi:uncharacterized protein LOC131638998 [Vicia villosa]|uniref:uncharacterized protein LOC131638998 n=1 Tax=Vicia villosa TaxID=3911 RepID=UPI00273C5A18|nr:uncharacterized protein LOC131638998 [Vicia villosa]
MGDFNNVLRVTDRVGGREVTASEYEDLVTMMDNLELFEKESQGDHFTWNNKQSNGMIYSRIDRVLGNIHWQQRNIDTTLYIMEPGVSDHSLLCLKDNIQTSPFKRQFKFPNVVTQTEGFLAAVKANWDLPMEGGAINLCKPFKGIQGQIEEARDELQSAQVELQMDRLNGSKAEKVKNLTEKVIHLNNIEEKMLAQRAKINWIRLGDGNNRFFHATLKGKNKQTRIQSLQTGSDDIVTDQQSIKEEVIQFYKNLVGTPASDLTGIDIEAMRRGPQLNRDQMEQLTVLVTDEEIYQCLMTMKDQTAPGGDGYNAKFYKVAWDIIKADVCQAVREFFEKEKIGQERSQARRPSLTYALCLGDGLLHRVLQKLKDNPNFKFHSKCKKLGIINHSFADDLLLFVKAETTSVSLLMENFKNFSSSTGLTANMQKCMIYYGNVAQVSKNTLSQITNFKEGTLPFRYLGIPLSSKKLSVVNCMVMVEKMTGKVRNWTNSLLSFAGRLQLVKSVLFAITNYWFHCVPLPMKVIQSAEAVCRSFLWSGSDKITRKHPVSWGQTCNPRKVGGLNIIDLKIWRKASLLKMLWNHSGKSDSLWIKWIHCYYVKSLTIMTVPVKASCSWILKTILNQRQAAMDLPCWNSMMLHPKFSTRIVYHELLQDLPVVQWQNLVYKNLARPKAQFILWIACNNRLPCKERLHHFGLLNSNECTFCNEIETLNHLMFECRITREIWTYILSWMQLVHTPLRWDEEIQWVMKKSKGKGSKASILKCAFTETIYETWLFRNRCCFGRSKVSDNGSIGPKIIDHIVYRSWLNHKLRHYVAKLMMP